MDEKANTTKRARRVLVCASGGYACYSLPGLVLHMLRHFADEVQVVLSRAAATMVSKYAVEVATRNPVFVEMDDHTGDVWVPHIELGRNVDLIVVYPATVNIIGKAANGIADELISAIILATTAPVIFVPVTNPAMGNHVAVQRNLRQLEEDGYIIAPVAIGPEIATREGLDEMTDPFPLPTLLLQMTSVLAAGNRRGIARRTSIAPE
jgi:phosphopantothenoylcysteine synthetase/decarboxylase